MRESFRERVDAYIRTILKLYTTASYFQFYMLPNISPLMEAPPLLLLATVQQHKHLITSRPKQMERQLPAIYCSSQTNIVSICKGDQLTTKRFCYDSEVVCLLFR